MEVIYNIMGTLATVVSLYSTICFVRIILSWIPGIQNHKVTQILSTICDPILNLFTSVKWLRFGNLDFSPLLSFALLSGISVILSSIAKSHTISFSFIICLIIQMIWSMINSLITILIIILIIRLIFLYLNKTFPGNWSVFDNLIYTISNTFTKLLNKSPFIDLKISILITIGTLILTKFVGTFIINLIIFVLQKIPF